VGKRARTRAMGILFCRMAILFVLWLCFSGLSKKVAYGARLSKKFAYAGMVRNSGLDLRQQPDLWEKYN
jgi:hypothetical protein